MMIKKKAPLLPPPSTNTHATIAASNTIITPHLPAFKRTTPISPSSSARNDVQARVNRIKRFKADEAKRGKQKGKVVAPVILQGPPPGYRPLSTTLPPVPSLPPPPSIRPLVKLVISPPVARKPQLEIPPTTSSPLVTATKPSKKEEKEKETEEDVSEEVLFSEIESPKASLEESSSEIDKISLKTLYSQLKLSVGDVFEKDSDFLKSIEEFETFEKQMFEDGKL